VGWRSSSNATKVRGIALVALLAAMAAGCGRYAVRPNEKEHLADRTMRFDADEEETEASDHVLDNREAATGGSGTGGGGCGCN
jgi:hypothetical protein